ncbi:STAS domain-containing protein [Desulfobacterales bacterium HSG16]|nr:STAS domain-containing protein [Desulfobacterales bacterium HSG16]
MVTSTEKIGNRTFIRVLKDIDDLKSGEEFKAALMDVYDKREKAVVIDFGNINLINSHGIGKILMFYRRFREIGGTIYVTPLKGSIKEIFKSLMLDKLISEIK